MKAKKFLMVLLATCSMGSLAAKEFETTILHLDASVFTMDAARDMSDPEVTPPHNWLSASGVEWTSSNCYARNIASPAHVGKAVAWGGADIAATGDATTPALDLRASEGEQIRLIIKITAGSNKSGSMVIKLDETPLGTISASADGDSGTGSTSFGGKYYTFVYPIANGTASSHLRFTHSKIDVAGNLYVQEIKVIKEPVSLVKMDCSAVSGSTKEMSDETGTYTWKTVFGEQIAANTTSAFCYAQNPASPTHIGKSVRLGGSSGNGAFTISDLDLLAPNQTKVKLYFEATTGSSNKDWKLDVTLNGSSSVASIPTLDYTTQWYEYDLEITNGTANSSITFTGSINSGTGNAQIYIRNLRIYYEPISTGIGRVSTEKLQIYPTIFTGELQVSSQLQSLEIYTISGVKVKNFGNIQSAINTSDLSSGYYILKLTDENGKHFSTKALKK
ncbi:MAG: T9SS type A sorting domain-containing protein [Candidatus Symbiothrix sp.]|jgi:hypothetical protein|nr:T9SS type A sorting domain-containing protein [Candidatus Symbiothrix sp.]